MEGVDILLLNAIIGGKKDEKENNNTNKYTESKKQMERGVKSNPFTPEERRRIADRLGVARRSMRNGRGVLQTEMAELLDVSHSHYSKCESGHNSFSGKFLECFSERTGVCLDWLISGEGDMYPSGGGEIREERQTWKSGEGKVVEAERAVPGEEWVRRVLESMRDSQVVAAAEALAQATGCGYDEAAAMVIARRLAVRY
jgi:transcriptional regulator with XRE-family HTH domain